MIPIGWSSGDLITGIGVLVKVGKAFKEAGGAEEKYVTQTEFVEGLKTTLEVLKDVVDKDQNPPQAIAAHIQRMDKPWKAFDKFLRKYEGRLHQTGDSSKTRKATGTVSWSLKELAGKVDDLKEAIDAPMKSLHLCLTTETWAASRTLPSLIGDTSDQAHLRMQQLGENVRTLVTAQIKSQQMDHESFSKEVDFIRASLTDGLNDLRALIIAETDDVKQEMNRNTMILLDAMSETSTDPMAVLNDVQETLRSIADILNASKDDKPVQRAGTKSSTDESIGRDTPIATDASSEDNETFISHLLDLGRATALVIAFIAGGLSAYQITTEPKSFPYTFEPICSDHFGYQPAHCISPVNAPPYSIHEEQPDLSIPEGQDQASIGDGP